VVAGSRSFAAIGQWAADAGPGMLAALGAAFASLTAAVITIDAMHTQTDTAHVITGQGADYVMTVKANMPTLYKRLKKLPWARVPATRQRRRLPQDELTFQSTQPAGGAAAEVMRLCPLTQKSDS
jgi:hypothetical protein